MIYTPTRRYILEGDRIAEKYNAEKYSSILCWHNGFMRGGSRIVSIKQDTLLSSCVSPPRVQMATLEELLRKPVKNAGIYTMDSDCWCSIEGE